MKLPMPNDTFDGGTVVASCSQIIDQEGESDEESACTLLILYPQAPFYAVLDVYEDEVLNSVSFPNIIPAAKEYSEQIGGY